MRRFTRRWLASGFAADVQRQTPATAEGERGNVIPLLPPKIRLATVRDVRRELARLYCDTRAGRVPASDAARMAFVLDRVRQCLVDHELEARLIGLEKVIEGGRHGEID